jgi:effector-binding domain-containing protein
MHETPRIAGIAALQRRRTQMPCLRFAAPLVLAFALAAAPAVAQPRPPAGVPSPLQPGDAFGEDVTMPERTIVYLKGTSQWDGAFDTLVDAFKSLNEYLDKQGIKPAGPAMTIYTQTDDKGFSFEAAVPIAAAPANPPKGDIAVGQAPSGKALKFVHRGSYDAMDSTYEAITNYLDDKHLDAKELFIEEYATDPVKTNVDNLVINVFVPVK